MSRRSQIKTDPQSIWKRNPTCTAIQSRVHTIGSNVAKSTQRSRVGTGKILICASGLFGDREVKKALIKMIFNKQIFKVLLITIYPLSQYQDGDRIATNDIHSVCQD